MGHNTHTLTTIVSNRTADEYTIQKGDVVSYTMPIPPHSDESDLFVVSDAITGEIAGTNADALAGRIPFSDPVRASAHAPSRVNSHASPGVPAAGVVQSS